jgi:transposase
VKGSAEALKKRATVVSMDEYRTSKLCSQCHCRLKEARLRTKDKDGILVLHENRDVLRCTNSQCKANFWNQDVNAARNILEILSARLLGFERIPAFAR